MSRSDDRMISLLSQSSLWKENGNQVWLASTLSIFRNIDKFNFPNKLQGSQQKVIVNLLESALLKEGVLKNPLITPAEELDPMGKEYLTEHFLSTTGFYHAHAGEAFAVEKSGNFLATINIGDHLHLTLIDTHGEVEKMWNRLIKIETAIGKAVNFSFSPRFGFLTSDPAECGSAIEIAAYLQLPALIHSEAIDEILSKNSDNSVAITGMHGSPTEVVGDLLLVKNNYTLGTTEEKTLATIENIATKLSVEENSKRQEIKQKGNGEIKDRVSRAYGILLHSYQIEAIEALNAISLVKLGRSLGWVNGISYSELNSLFFNCRRAHLLYRYNGEVAQEELAHKRAEYIHETLMNVKLTV